MAGMVIIYLKNLMEVHLAELEVFNKKLRKIPLFLRIFLNKTNLHLRLPN